MLHTGKLDLFLAHRRVNRALSLLEDVPTPRLLVDIGCGNLPALALAAKGENRLGLDLRIWPNWVQDKDGSGVTLLTADASKRLPLKDGTVDVVAMLAVIEHLNSEAATRVLHETLRILRPGGVLVLTTPPPRTDRLLPLLAKIGLVNREAIEEHSHVMDRQSLEDALNGAGYCGIRAGHFELGFNVWAKAYKPTEDRLLAPSQPQNR